MNAEQYRALVNKLEAIQEAEVLDPNADPAQSAMNVASNNVPQPATATDPNQIPTIEAATFNQAYAQAVKQGLRKFKWCGIYAVKSKPQPVRPQPATDTLPNTRTAPAELNVPNNTSGRFQAGVSNLI